MDEDTLTSKAISELMRDIDGQNVTPKQYPKERKINPLGTMNKRFLGRTINTALIHNRREAERTQANCQQKLQELDDKLERRKSNKEAGVHKRSSERSKRKLLRLSRNRRNSANFSDSSRESNNISHTVNYKNKHRKRHKSKIHQKQSSRSRISHDHSEKPATSLVKNDIFLDDNNQYLQQSNPIAFALGTVSNCDWYRYNQIVNKKEENEICESPIHDIMRELMSDDDGSKESLSSSYSENEKKLLTINISSSDSSSSEISIVESDGSCVQECNDSDSDMEIIDTIEVDSEQESTENTTQQMQPTEQKATIAIDLTID